MSVLTPPAILSNANFRLYWIGVILSQVGSRATVAATLWQIYQLTDSTLQVGVVGISEAIALLVLSPIGGVVADRMDRRRLLQVMQGVSMVVGIALAALTMSAVIESWHIYLGVLVISAAVTLDTPARQALIPSLVPREQLVQAFALTNPTRELAYLIGPAVGGLIIAAWGPAQVYLFDAFTYGVLILALGLIRIPRIPPPAHQPGLWESFGEGVAFVRQRPIIWQLMSLDLAATVFGAYRVVLPALARDVLGVGAAGYGLLAACAPAGAIAGSALLLRVARAGPSGRLVLGATMGYGLAVVALAQARTLPLAIAAACAIGLFDAWTTTVRHAAVQLETPDHVRGRVTSLYSMAARGGPSVGSLLIGALAAAVSVPVALTIGGLVPVAYALALLTRGRTVRSYAGAKPVG